MSGKTFKIKNPEKQLKRNELTYKNKLVKMKKWENLKIHKMMNLNKKILFKETMIIQMKKMKIGFPTKKAM